MNWRSLLRIGIIAGTTGTVVAVKANDWNISTIGLVRFGRAAVTVADISLDYKLSLKDIATSSVQYNEIISQVHARSAEKLLDLCRLNGGAFIKVGQHIGTMDYLLPDEYVDTLKILHSQAPKSSYEEVISVVEHDLNKDPNEIFQCFNHEPIGAASLAQVHKAILKDGTLVAVKVQHPKVQKHSFVDMKTMELLVNIVGKIFPDFKFQWLADEMKKNLPIELDFVNEGRNAERVASIYKKFSWLKIPKIHWQLSTSRVLMMEFCEGGQINDRNYIIKNNIDPIAISKMLGELYSEMIFVEGFVHCDPHPGNLLVHSVDEKPNIVLLDHGLYRNLSDDFRVRYSKLWMAILKADVHRIKRHATGLNVGDLYGVLAGMVTARSWKSIQEGIVEKEFSDDEGSHIKTTAPRYLPHITQVLDRIPRDMILILKTNDLLRGIEHTLTQKHPKVGATTMTRCCLKTLYQHKFDTCDTYLCQLRQIIYYYWLSFKLFLEDYLREHKFKNKTIEKVIKVGAKSVLFI